MTREIGVAVIGFGWMGRVHTRAHHRVAEHFPDLGLRPRPIAVVDEVPGRAAEAARLHGFDRAETDWRAVLADPAIELVSVTAPNFAHREIGVAVAEAGKHLWIEKPVGVRSADARAVAVALDAGGRHSAVGFNYRNAPAVAEARRQLADGAIGRVTHASVRMIGDYAADVAGAYTWRYERARAGRGVIADLGSHAVDLVRHVLGEPIAVLADAAVRIPERRRPDGATTGHARSEHGELVAVENEDWAAGVLRLADGVRVSFEISRIATGHQNDYGFRIHGTQGVLEWDFRRMGELGVAHGDSGQDLGVTTRYVGPEAGDFGAFQPGGGIAMSYDDLKVIELAAVLRAIDGSGPGGATIHDAVRSAELVDALAASADRGTWVTVP